MNSERRVNHEVKREWCIKTAGEDLGGQDDDKVSSGGRSSQVDSPIRCRSKCFGTHSSGDIVGHGVAQQASHSWASVDQVLLPTTPRVDSKTLRLDDK
ncbi:hypothetical protein TNCV_1272881 [Trichonephila clavipes]|nr:hypothetical protein TNCV_1272881 [Trichonephila clavipes]